MKQMTPSHFTQKSIYGLFFPVTVCHSWKHFPWPPGHHCHFRTSPAAPPQHLLPFLLPALSTLELPRTQSSNLSSLYTHPLYALIQTHVFKYLCTFQWLLKCLYPRPLFWILDSYIQLLIQNLPLDFTNKHSKFFMYKPELWNSLDSPKYTLRQEPRAIVNLRNKKDEYIVCKDHWNFFPLCTPALLQCDFDIPSIKKWDLSLHPLDVVWHCVLLWPKGSSRGDILRLLTPGLRMCCCSHYCLLRILPRDCHVDSLVEDEKELGADKPSP